MIQKYTGGVVNPANQIKFGNFDKNTGWNIAEREKGKTE